MPEAPRYSFSTQQPDRDSTGDWVRLKDHARVVAQRDRLREACCELIAACDGLDAFILTGQPCGQQRRADDAIAEARAALAECEDH